MRTLSRSERRLAFTLGTIVFCFANFYGLQALWKKKQSLQARLAEQRMEDTESARWLEERDLWTARQKWLAEHQPVIQSDADGNSALLESLQSSARRQNITIVEQTLLEPSAQPFYRKAEVRLKIAGTLESITKWLVELQQPEKFQVIGRFTLKSDAEPPKMKCELQVARLYAAP